ncbi:hypothetical protein [Erwinia sorbitola]|uniref:Uncharacterized protein n=1 Tax=Erwinia sorbitola TaxID=2681984 RepID=A0A6I6EQ41_9GAMM|nr:hypothetical protein [Erwinia sorbitola]MTD27723.1 hypothetical protein [Erwinia sorbitola]QGU86273.1 hypothetical protein GN242_03100 [Erwinia sorbitola]
MKWKIASGSLLLATVVVLLIAAMMNRLPGRQTMLFSPSFRGVDVQLGYYDLLSRQREVYDTAFTTENKILSLTVTSPNDNRFGVKVHLLQRSIGQGEVTFDLKPVYHKDDHRDRMIRNMLGYNWQKEVRFDTLNFNGEHLIIIPSGQLFSYR